jgi:hypothetical protein
MSPIHHLIVMARFDPRFRGVAIGQGAHPRAAGVYNRLDGALLRATTQGFE